MQQHYGQTPQVIITLPLLEGLDGVQKMSKSLNNYVGITDPPEEMFGKLMSISDELMWRYFDLLSFRSNEDLAALKAEVEGGRNPRDVKFLLCETPGLLLQPANHLSPSSSGDKCPKTFLKKPWRPVEMELDLRRRSSSADWFPVIPRHSG